jgi:hypothetical protein
VRIAEFAMRRIQASITGDTCQNVLKPEPGANISLVRATGYQPVRIIAPVLAGDFKMLLAIAFHGCSAIKTPTAVIVALTALYVADALYCRGRYFETTLRMSQSIASTLGYR